MRRKVWTFNVAVDFWRHPKAVLAGRDGRDLFLAALGWSGEYRQDGHVPAEALDQLAGLVGITPTAARKARSKLVAVGMWEPVDGGWLIHDYLEWQMSAEERDAKAKAAAERQKAYQARRAAQADDEPPDPPDDTEHDASSRASDDGSETPQRGVRGSVGSSSVGSSHLTRDSSATNGDSRPEPSPGGEQKDQVDATFETFWAGFPKRAGRLRDRDGTHRKWRQMTSSERAAALRALPHYAAERGDDKPTAAKDPLRWLQHRTWADYLEPPATVTRLDQRQRPGRVMPSQRFAARQQPPGGATQ